MRLVDVVLDPSFLDIKINVTRSFGQQATHTASSSNPGRGWIEWSIGLRGHEVCSFKIGDGSQLEIAAVDLSKRQRQRVSELYK